MTDKNNGTWRTESAFRETMDRVGTESQTFKGIPVCMIKCIFLKNQ